MTEQNGWKTVEVKDLAANERHSFIDGDWVEAPFITTSGVRLIQTGNIGIGKFIDRNKKYISNESFDFLKCKDVFAGDILICRLADPIGRSCVVPDLNGRAITSVDVCILRVNSEEYARDFVAHALNQRPFLTACEEKSGGSTRQRISRTNLGTIAILVPEDKREQAKIAEILSTVDRAIEQTEALIAKQQRIKTGLMQDLLTRGIDEHGNLRSEETHQFKDSPLGRIPVEWTFEPLWHFVPSAEYGISTSLGDYGHPVLRMNNFCDGEAVITDLKYTDIPVPSHLWLRDGDVLFNRTNSWEHVGRTGIWRGQAENTTFASYLVRLNPNPDLLTSELLNLWLNWQPIQISMRRLATPAVQQVNINPTNLRSIHAAFPQSLEEQWEIVSRLTGTRTVIESSAEQLGKLLSLKTALMQDLLTGEKRVTPLLETAETT